MDEQSELSGGPAPGRAHEQLRRHRPGRRLTGRDAEDCVLALGDGREVRGGHLLVATGRRPRVDGIGLDTVGVHADRHGIPVDTHLRADDGLWAIGDVTGVRLLNHVGKYQGEVVAANILGEPVR